MAPRGRVIIYFIVRLCTRGINDRIRFSYFDNVLMLFDRRPRKWFNAIYVNDFTLAVSRLIVLVFPNVFSFFQRQQYWHNNITSPQSQKVKISLSLNINIQRLQRGVRRHVVYTSVNTRSFNFIEINVSGESFSSEFSDRLLSPKPALDSTSLAPASVSTPQR